MTIATTFRTIRDRPVLWEDKQGFVHACEGGELHPGVRVLWTLCERDVQGNSAYLANANSSITCATCKARNVITFEDR